MSQPISIQTPDRDRSAIKLVFEQRADRWAQQWILITNQAPHVFLKSVEGSPDQSWPPSPPLQEVSHHELETGDAVLCVGMAGKSHWSASYSLESSTESGQVLIKSDLACLQKGESSAPVKSPTMGSTFELDATCKVVSCTRDRIELLPSTDRAIVLTTISGEGYETVFELVDHTLRVRPCHLSNSPVVATRWVFGVQAAN